MPKKLVIIAIIALILAVTWKLWPRELPQEKLTENKPEQYQNLQVKLYIKSSCFFCQKALSLLEEKGIKYEIIELTDNRELQLALIEQTGQTTVPYIFINNQFIGGFDQLNHISWEELANNSKQEANN